jgi:predicted nucleotidyltransferase component of viral defense system
MSASLEYLERCSAETGYQVAALEKVVRLGELAADVARHPFLGAVLVLKGGTVLNLGFGPPGRLSVDLDYNYIGHIERERMLQDRPRVESAMVDLARRRGYAVQRSADAFAGRKLYLGYRSVLGQADRIEGDLNFLFRIPVVETETRFLWQPGELDRARVRVVGVAELLVGKLLALLDRGAARDAWDVANLPEATAGELTSPLFRSRFMALSAVLEHQLSTYTRDRLARLVTDRTIAEQLTPMLASTAPPRSVDLVQRAWVRIAPFVSVEKTEAAYLAAIYRGELRPELLFPSDASEADRMARHPAILWKIANVRAHLKRHNRKPKRGAPTNDPTGN